MKFPSSLYSRKRRKEKKQKKKENKRQIKEDDRISVLTWTDFSRCGFVTRVSLHPQVHIHYIKTQKYIPGRNSLRSFGQTWVRLGMLCMYDCLYIYGTFTSIIYYTKYNSNFFLGSYCVNSPKEPSNQWPHKQWIWFSIGHEGSFPTSPRPSRVLDLKRVSSVEQEITQVRSPRWCREAKVVGLERP